MGKLPAFLFYPADWLTDNVSGCSLAAQGLWLRMMIVMHSAERRGFLIMNGRPMTDEFVAARCGTDITAYRTLLDELLLAGVPRRNNEGFLYNKRMAEDERVRQQTRNRVAKFRSNGDVTEDVTQKKRRCTEDVNVTENETETVDVVKENLRSPRPSLGEVQAYCLERNNDVDHQQWFDFYTSKGWMIGKSPMKDWRAAVRTWERNSGNGKPKKSGPCEKHPHSGITDRGGCGGCYFADQE